MSGSDGNKISTGSMTQITKEKTQVSPLLDLGVELPLGDRKEKECERLSDNIALLLLFGLGLVRGGEVVVKGGMFVLG